MIFDVVNMTSYDIILKNIIAQKAYFTDQLKARNTYYKVQVYTQLRILSPIKYSKK